MLQVVTNVTKDRHGRSAPTEHTKMFTWPRFVLLNGLSCQLSYFRYENGFVVIYIYIYIYIIYEAGGGGGQGGHVPPPPRF